jgi:Helicase associated domain
MILKYPLAVLAWWLSGAPVVVRGHAQSAVQLSKSAAKLERSLTGDMTVFVVVENGCKVCYLGQSEAGRTRFRIDCDSSDDFYNYDGDGDGHATILITDDDTDDGDEVEDEHSPMEENIPRPTLAPEKDTDDIVEDDPFAALDSVGDDTVEDEDIDTEAIVSGVETEVVANKDTTTGSSLGVWPIIGITFLGLLVLWCLWYMCFGRNRGERGRVHNFDDDNHNKTLDGEDIEQQSNSIAVGHIAPFGAYRELEEDGSWEDYVKALVAFKARHGHFQVPSTYLDPKSGLRLGQWVAQQRYSVQTNALSQEKVDELSKLGFDWSDLHDAEWTEEDYEAVADPNKWEEHLSALKDFKDSYGRDCQVPYSYRDVDGRPLGLWVHYQRHHMKLLTKDQIRQLDDVGFDWIIQGADWTARDYEGVADPNKWEALLHALKDYHLKHGHVQVPFSFRDAEGRPLGLWVHHQRKHKALLSEDQTKQLEALGFDWNIQCTGWNAQDYEVVADLKRWEEYFDALKEYRVANGNCLVPYSYRDADGRPLGLWVHHQRLYQNLLSKDDKAKLDALGFDWHIQDPHWTADDFAVVSNPLLWDEYLQALKEYSALHGDCNVPYSYRDAEGRPLGLWVHYQKQYQNLLTHDQRAKLDALGFDWNIPSGVGLGGEKKRQKPKRTSSVLQRLLSLTNRSKKRSTQFDEDTGSFDDAEWDKYVRALIDFKAEHGHCNVNRRFKDGNGFPLGEWVSAQRVRHALNLLPLDKYHELSELGFIWELQPEDDEYRNGPTMAELMDGWSAYAKSLKRFQKTNKHCQVPLTYKDNKGRQLGRWVSSVRDVAAQNELPYDKRAELAAIGFDWETPRGDGYGLAGGCGYGRWEVHFEALEGYKMEHGDCDVPGKYKTRNGLYLGAWVANQRSRAAQEELPWENCDRLTVLGFDWVGAQDDCDGVMEWERHIQSVAGYIAKHGDVPIPKTFEDESGVGLGSWCINLSHKAAQDLLDDDQRRDLTSLGFNWNTFAFDGKAVESVGIGGRGGRETVNVHMCSSAVCDVCKVESQKSVSFMAVPVKKS